jgi:hypothetical protein
LFSLSACHHRRRAKWEHSDKLTGEEEGVTSRLYNVLPPNPWALCVVGFT